VLSLSHGPARPGRNPRAGCQERAAGDPARPVTPAAAPIPAARWWPAAAGLAGLGTDAGIASLSSSLGAAVVITEITTIAVIALVIVLTAIWGPDQKCERVFRLLRWAANRPEPPRAAATAVEPSGQHNPGPPALGS
jgi:hypothetical protein